MKYDFIFQFDRLFEVRERLYESIAHGIPAEVIFKVKHLLFFIEVIDSDFFSGFIVRLDSKL